MKFSTVEIKTNIIADWEKRDKEKPVWGVIFYDDPQDRQGTVTKPNPMGFYHYPTKRVTKARAFAALKDVIIKAHKDQIAMLSHSLRSLEALTL